MSVLRSVAEVAAAIGALGELEEPGALGALEEPGESSALGEPGALGAPRRERTGRIVVGIAGSPGAGKSTIAAELVALLPGAALLPMDGFHLPQSRLVELGRRDRMGAPDTFDVDAYVATLAALRAGGNSGTPVAAPGFDREIEEPVPRAITISPEFPIVVTEGNYLLLGHGGWERVAPLLDATFFVAVDRDIRLSRLIARHEKFGKSPVDAAAWATGTDERNAALVEASASAATHTIALG